MNVTVALNRLHVAPRSRTWMLWDAEAEKLLEVGELFETTGYDMARNPIQVPTGMVYIGEQFGKELQGNLDASLHLAEAFNFRIVWRQGEGAVPAIVLQVEGNIDCEKL
jgi:hypothetical protein